MSLPSTPATTNFTLIAPADPKHPSKLGCFSADWVRGGTFGPSKIKILCDGGSEHSESYAEVIWHHHGSCAPGSISRDGASRQEL